MNIKVNKKQYETYHLILLQRKRKKKQDDEIFQPVGLCLVNSEVSGGEWAYVDESGNVVDAPDFNSHPLFSSIQDEIIEGQYMVKFPAFWVQRRVNLAGPHIGKEVWFAHHAPRAGYDLHMAFWWGGQPKSKFWLGKYQASLSNDGELSSIPGVMPAVNITIGGFDTAACLRNEVCPDGGFVQHNFWMWSALQWLTLLRYATMDIQAAVGRGRVDASSAALVDAAGVAQATVFGVVGAWGNVWQFARGAQFEAGRVWLWDENQQLVDTGHTVPDLIDVWRFPKTFATGSGAGFNLSHGFLAATNQAGLAGATCQDGHFFTTKAARGLRLCGRWNTGTYAGLWCTNGQQDSAYADTSIGSRLAKVEI